MIGRAVVCLLAALCVADARVDFAHSQIYDEYDFRSGQSSVSIEGLCKDSCRIYASITNESKAFAANLLIQTAKGFVSVADVAARVDPATNQKLYLQVNNTASLVIANVNTKQVDDAPLVVYVVNEAGGDVGFPEVYEAEGLHRPQGAKISTLTVMSARPFTLKQAADEGAVGQARQAVVAQMTGFDAVVSYTEHCPNLYNLDYAPFPGFTLEVNGPIVSLLYDLNEVHFPPGDITATIGISNHRQLERTGWIGSPGFHGCLNKQYYRSSLYSDNAPFHAEITNEQPESISVQVVTNSNTKHAVILTDADNGRQYSVSETSDSVPFNLNFNTKNLTINWTPERTGYPHFLLRWNSTIVPHS